jgi:hypothetical protein
MNDPNERANQPVTITRERWRWEQILLCLDRYVSALRGDYDALFEDVEWANQLDAMTHELRAIVNAGGNHDTASHPRPQPAGDSRAGSESVSEAGTAYHAERGNSTPRRNPHWSAEENEAVIAAYFWMFDEQNAFRAFNKAAKYRALQAGALHLRSRQSIERKMQNISAVLQQHGIDWVEGLAPLPNYQHDLAAVVEEVLAARELIDIDPPNQEQ